MTESCQFDNADVQPKSILMMTIIYYYYTTTHFRLCLAKCTRSLRIPWSSQPGLPSRWAYPRRSCRAACSCARFGRRHRPRLGQRDRVSTGYERDACAAFDACY